MVSEVSKLRPELLTKSVAELNRLRDEIELAIGEKAKAEAEARKAAIIEKARDAYEPMLDTLKLYHENGLLSETIVAALSRQDGTFAPHQKIKKPRI